jgi:hypothetical protein
MRSSTECEKNGRGRFDSQIRFRFDCAPGAICQIRPGKASFFAISRLARGHCDPTAAAAQARPRPAPAGREARNLFRLNLLRNEWASGRQCARTVYPQAFAKGEILWLDERPSMLSCLQ